MAKSIELGFIGLGKMGSGMVTRLLKSKKIKVVAFDKSQKAVNASAKLGAKKSTSISDLFSKLKQKKKNNLVNVASW